MVEKSLLFILQTSEVAQLADFDLFFFDTSTGSATPRAKVNQQNQRDALISLHQHIRNRISQGVDSDFEQYEERAMIHSIIEAPEKRLDLNLLSRELQLGQRQVSELLEEVKAKLQRQISHRAGHVIAAPENSELYWWLGDYKSN